MFGCYTKEDQDKAIRSQAVAYREAANLFPQIRKVIEDFNGKCFNCRFEKAIQEATGQRVFVKKEYERFLNIYTYKPHSGEQLTLAHIKLEDMPEGKRIPGDLLIESLKSCRERFLREAADLEGMIEKADFIKEQLQYFKSQIDKIVSTIPYKARDIYHLDYHVQTR